MCASVHIKRIKIALTSKYPFVCMLKVTIDTFRQKFEKSCPLQRTETHPLNSTNECFA